MHCTYNINHTNVHERCWHILCRNVEIINQFNYIYETFRFAMLYGRCASTRSTKIKKMYVHRWVSCIETHSSPYAINIPIDVDRSISINPSISFRLSGIAAAGHRATAYSVARLYGLSIRFKFIRNTQRSGSMHNDQPRVPGHRTVCDEHRLSDAIQEPHKSQQ